LIGTMSDGVTITMMLMRGAEVFLWPHHVHVRIAMWTIRDLQAARINHNLRAMFNALRDVAGFDTFDHRFLGRRLEEDLDFVAQRVGETAELRARL
jgi:hypothetical protein